MDPWFWSWLAAAPIVAHVLYGVPSGPGGGRRIVTLHNGDGFSGDDEAPRPDRLHGVRVVSDAGVQPLTAAGSRESGVHVDVGGVTAPAWVVVETAPTFIELAPAKFERYLAHEGLTDVLRARREAGTSGEPGREIYSKHIKTAVADPAGPPHLRTDAIGLPLEIVPAIAVLQVGDEFRGQVLLDGQPARDVQVRVHHKGTDGAAAREVACLRTGANGAFAVRLDARGLWRCHVIVMRRHQDAAHAEWRSVWASLTFRL